MHKVGQQARSWLDGSRHNWSLTGPRPLSSVVWYPTEDGVTPQDFFFGTPEPLFFVRDVAVGAPPLAGPQRLPLVLLSHGTGGSALQLGWLAQTLAAHGHLVVAVNHHGNTSVESYQPQGFLLWWERARDLSVVIDRVLADPVFGHRIDAARIGAAGFSLGGYTVVAAVGGRCSLDHFQAASRARSEAVPQGPRELPDASRWFDEFMQRDPVFRDSVAAHGQSYRDPRIRAAFVMNPALGEAFEDRALAGLDVPMQVVVCEADEDVPPPFNGCRYAQLVPGAGLTWIHGPVGHYVFLAEATAEGRRSLPHLCEDDPSVDRRAVHAHVALLAVSFFERHLAVREVS
jgi:predicted dienelactone hydrolase